jgi:hypothetical protein
MQLEPEQRAQYAAVLPEMTDVQLEDALQEFRAALVFTGAVGHGLRYSPVRFHMVDQRRQHS